MRKQTLLPRWQNIFKALGFARSGRQNGIDQVKRHPLRFEPLEDRHLLSVLSWDPRQSAGGNLGGPGTWNSTAAVWYNPDTFSDVVWNNESGDTAVFQGNAGAVTLGSNFNAGGIEFDISSYTLSGATITLIDNNNSGWVGGEIRVNATADAINAVLAGSVGLTKTGAGTLTLSGTNTFNGATLKAGRLEALNGGAVGSATLTLAGGAFYGQGTFNNDIVAGENTVSTIAPVSGTLVLAGPISGLGEIDASTYGSGDAYIDLNGDNSDFGGVYYQPADTPQGKIYTYLGSSLSGSADATWNIDGGVLAGDNDHVLDIQLGALSGGGTLSNANGADSVNFYIGDKSVPTQFDGVIEDGNGAVDLTKVGTATFTLTGENTYDGSTNVRGGTLVLARSENCLSDATCVLLGDPVYCGSGTLQLGDGETSCTQSIAALYTNNGTEDRVVGGTDGNNKLIITFSDYGDIDEYYGMLGGPGTNQNNFALEMDGDSVVVLMGDDTYTGGTYINSGLLGAMTTPTAMGTGTVFLNGGVLAGAYTALDNPIEVDADSYIFTLDNFTLNGNITSDQSNPVTINCTNLLYGDSSLDASLYLGGENSGFHGTFFQFVTHNYFDTSCMYTYFTNAAAGSAHADWNIDEGLLAGDLSETGTVALGGLSGWGTLGNVTPGNTVTYEVGGNDESTEFHGLIADGDPLAASESCESTLAHSQADTVSAAEGITPIFPAGSLPGLDRWLAANGGTPTTVADADRGSSESDVLTESGSGTVALTKTGAGTLVLSGDNTYTGVTTLDAGTLSLNSANPIGNGTSHSIVCNGGTLQFTEANATDYSSRFSNDTGQAFNIDTNGQSVTFASALASPSGGTLNKLGAGTLVLKGSNTYSGATTVSAGTLQLGDGTMNGSVAGTVNVADGTDLVFDNVADVTQIFTRQIHGSGTLTKTGAGRLSLRAASNYHGDVRISSGTLLQGGSSLGTGGITLAGGTLSDAGVVGNAITAEAGTTSGLFASGMTLTLTGGISGLGTVVQDSGGTINLQGDDSGFWGTFRTTGGISTCFTSAAAGSSHATWEIDGGKLTSNVSAATIMLGALVGNSNGTLTSNASGGTVTYQIGDANAPSDFGGIIQDGTGPVAITKTGTAALTLAGANTFTGGTTVEDGVMFVAGTVGNVVVDGGALSPGVSGAGTGNTGSLTLATGSSYGVDITNTGGGLADVTGTVTLNSAALDVSTDRTTNAYGILRVLIENDGTDAVVGTFDGRAEGDTVSAGGVMYWITYQYNAEAGQFDTGNDVALVSSLFSVSAGSESQVLTGTTDELVRDATLQTEQYGSQFQLHTSVSQHNSNWPVGEPTFTFTDEDPTVASLDENRVVTFHHTGVCQIRVESPATESTPEQTFELPLAGTATETSTYIPDAITPENVGNYVLVLYNADSPDGSTALMNYYKGTAQQPGRPGMLNATYLGISGTDLLAHGYYLGNGVTTLPDTVGTSYASEYICDAIVGYVKQYIDNAEQGSSATQFRYIVGLCGLPSRVGYSAGDGGASVSYMIYTELLAESGRAGYIGGTDRFSVAEYGAPLVAWLDCGSYAATYAYINKEIVVAAADGLQPDGITISGSAAQIGGTTYYLDDTSTYGSDYFSDSYADLGPDGLGEDVVYQPYSGHTFISTVTDPTAYGSWGYHTTDTWNDWPLNGQVTIEIAKTLRIDTQDCHLGWWIGMSVESYNGMYGYYMGDPVDFFSAAAFGGTAETVSIGGVNRTYYTTTPICFVGSTHEPYPDGAENAAYFDRWAHGWSTVEAAWAGVTISQWTGTTYPVIVTDVFVVS